MNKMNKARCILLLCLLCPGVLAAFTSATLTDATFKAATKFNGGCLHYKLPTRFCVWLSPLGKLNTTPVLDHYLPDLVVVVFRNGDEDPWTEAHDVLDAVANKAQESIWPKSGGGDQPFLQADDHGTIFKEADVIGNPGLIVLPQELALLPSTAVPWRPYFQSMLDSALWRGFMPQAAVEEAASLALGNLHHVGTGITDWGGVYPHEGTVMGLDDVQAAMVIAQRAADLLTTNYPFAHVRVPLSNQCGQHCKASPIQENSKETLFQMVSPIAQDECYMFGSDGSYSADMHNDEGAYVWIVWRHYQGCPDGEGTFIGKTP